MKIVVIGGGVIGSTTTFFLSQIPGMQITLLEAQKSPGLGASTANGGILTHVFNTPWPCPQILKKFYTGLIDPYYPLKFDFKCFLNKDFYRWATRFLVNSSEATFEVSHKKIYNMGVRSYDLHLQIKESLGQTKYDSKAKNEIYSQSQLPKLRSYGDVSQGALFVFTTKQKFEHAVKYYTENSARLYPNPNLQYLDQLSQIYDLDPFLKSSTVPIYGAIYRKEERSSHDSFEFLNEYLRLAQENLNTKVICDAQVDQFEIKGNQIKSVTTQSGKKITGDIFIIATGRDSRELGKKIGLWIPVWPFKGYTNTIKPKNGAPKHNIAIDEQFYFAPIKNNQVRGSGYAICTQDMSTNLNQLQKLNEKSMQLFNNQGWQDWTLARPVSADDIPIVGKMSQYENLYVNTGHGARGSKYSLASAELISQLISGKKTYLNWQDYDPNRFYIL